MFSESEMGVRVLGWFRVFGSLWVNLRSNWFGATL